MAVTQQYFIGYTHVGHQLMLQYRPFSTTEEMDRALIEHWNSTVKPTDIVWHLGDFGFGDADRTRKIFQQLHGRIRLIVGNHDTDSKGRVHKQLADLDWDQPPVQMAEAHVDGERVTLCHYGMRVWPASHHGSWHFFGHSHGRLPAYSRSRDVGVDCPDVAFTPRTFRQLTAGMVVAEVAA
ncbi:metallophosphoesterase family protein [Neorhizobium galegae]|uniref:metallophosphoesterase family protein n=1 Tax=Neorhizobium galegae TaxID=399 RepID=UPI0021027D23|nr:metallophosphoesterase family protein [Neorhizobium galegae]MCQ1855887.1 metallophosphoesterase family protein [Neorhizobium galegae]